MVDIDCKHVHLDETSINNATHTAQCYSCGARVYYDRIISNPKSNQVAYMPSDPNKPNNRYICSNCGHEEFASKGPVPSGWMCERCFKDMILDKTMNKENVDHPKHYNQHPSGIECIVIVEHMTFNAGNAVSYIWRAGLKGDIIEDLEKAKWYIEREIKRLKPGNCHHNRGLAPKNYGPCLDCKAQEK